MIEFQLKETAKRYDVCIIGSGAGGGMAAHVLANAGVKVVLLEAGRFYDPAQHQRLLKFPYEFPGRGAVTAKNPYGDFFVPDGGWKIEGEPYTQKDGSKFNWFRSRMLGGRTNQWGKISLRFGPDDFQRRSMDGLGENWPITYDDLEPYYDELDRLVGVFGSVEGLRNDPDGLFLPPPAPRLHELLIKRSAARLGINVIPSRLSILTRNVGNDQRKPCMFCGQCYRGCSQYSDFSSASVLLKPAVETGNLLIVTNAMARQIKTDQNGKATGVSYVNTIDMKEFEVNCRIVVLAASAAESARLLLNSKSPQHPNGLGNSSNLVGKYLHDSTGVSVAGILPSLFHRKRYNEDGVAGMHVYSPWWLDNRSLDFPRGYHIEYWGGFDMPTYGFGFGIESMNGLLPSADGKKKLPGGFGKTLKADHRTLYGAMVGMAGRGEAIAREDNFCEIDPETVDRFGIPVLRFRYKWSDYEIKQAKHMQETFHEMIHNMGGHVLTPFRDANENYGLEDPGRIIHEVGTTRMGFDMKKSVLNQFGQAHDCKNVFVVDGGTFVSQPDKNPTWTILALSMRSSKYLVNQLKSMSL